MTRRELFQRLVSAVAVGPLARLLPAPDWRSLVSEPVPVTFMGAPIIWDHLRFASPIQEDFFRESPLLEYIKRKQRARHAWVGETWLGADW